MIRLSPPVYACSEASGEGVRYAYGSSCRPPSALLQFECLCAVSLAAHICPHTLSRLKLPSHCCCCCRCCTYRCGAAALGPDVCPFMSILPPLHTFIIRPPSQFPCHCWLQIDVVQRRVDLMAAEGVRFVVNAHVGKNVEVRVLGGCVAQVRRCCDLHSTLTHAPHLGQGPGRVVRLRAAGCRRHQAPGSPC